MYNEKEEFISRNSFVCDVYYYLGINTGKRLTVSMSNIMLANVEALVFAEELPEVTIKCGTNEGPCWVREGAATCIDGWCTQNCKFSGSTQNGCIRRWRR